MSLLVAGLAVFLAIGLAQIVFAGRLVDMIHGGPGRRGPKGRSLDMLVLRSAGVFLTVLATLALGTIVLTGSI